MKQKLGFIGMGVMGASMATRLVAAGYVVTIWNRSKNERLARVVAAGANSADSLQEMKHSAEIIVLCLSNGAVVQELLFGSEGLFAGDTKNNSVRIIIDCSTIAPQESKAFSSQLAKIGVSYLDAPVSGGDIGAREGTLTVMVGGEQRAFEEARPLLEQLGKKIVLVGPVGSGQMTKCINQVAVALGVTAMTEALVLAERAGLKLDTTLEIIASGAAGSWALDNYAPRVLRGDLKPGFSAAHMLKDLRIALAEGASIGTELPGTELVAGLFEVLAAIPGEDLGNHALKRVYEIAAGGKFPACSP